MARTTSRHRCTPSRPCYTNRKVAAIFQRYYSGGGGGPSNDPLWFLAGGAIPASANYTIYDPLSAASLEESYVNKANPGTRDAAPGVAPTHAQGTGWTFNGSTQYLKTGTLAKDEQTVIIWVENATGVYAIGSFTNVGGVREKWIRPISSLTTVFRRAQQSRAFQSPTRGAILAIAKDRAYKNAVIHEGLLGTWSGGDGIEMYVGAQNNNGSADNFMAGNILRCAIYDFALSTGQVEAVTHAMYNYFQPAHSSYTQKILALNPIAYWPMDQAIGSPCFDLSGNKAHADNFGLTVGQSGMTHGLAIAGNGNANNSVRTIRDFPGLSGIDMNEFSFSCRIKVTADVSNQIRVMNAYTNGGNEYFVCEIRNGVGVGLFCRENGSDQTASVTNVTDGQEHHLVCYNSLSEGKIGIYLDGQNFEINKTLGGFNDQFPDEMYPIIWQDAFGLIHHCAFFAGKLTQEQVNTIL